MTVHAPISKREVSVEHRKTSDAQRSAAKPKAKAKVKAKAQPKKAKAVVLLSKDPSNDVLISFLILCYILLSFLLDHLFFSEILLLFV